MAQPCPGAEQFRRLLADQLDGPEARAAGAHVETCAGCQQALQLTASVGAWPPPPAATESFLNRLYARLPAKVGLNQIDLATSAAPDDLVLLDDTLEALARSDPVAAQVVKLRYYAGLSVEQAAELLGVSRSTAYER